MSTCCCVPLGFLAASNVSAGGGGGGGAFSAQTVAAQFDASGNASFTFNLSQLNFIAVACLTSGSTNYPTASGWTITVGSTAPTIMPNALPSTFQGIPFINNNSSAGTDDGGRGRIQEYAFIPQVSTAGSTITLTLNVSGATTSHYAWILAMANANIDSSSISNVGQGPLNFLESSARTRYTLGLQAPSTGYTTGATAYWLKMLCKWNVATSATITTGFTLLDSFSAATQFTDVFHGSATLGNRWIAFGFAEGAFMSATTAGSIGRHELFTGSGSSANWSFYSRYIQQ